MKKTVTWFLKAFIASLISLVLLSGFCWFYYNTPIHYKNETYSTDYKWEKNSVAIKATEGFAYSKIDENGYSNAYVPKKDDVDILVMGSSHTEGFNVNYDENFTYVLNELFTKAEEDLYAYNIGISGHTIIRCFRNLENAINEFKPQKYIVIETDNVTPDVASLRSLAEGTFPVLESHNTGLIYHLQKNDYLRLLHSQLSNFISKNEDIETTKDADNISDYEYYLNEMFKRGREIAENAGCELIVFNNANVDIDSNGNVIEQTTTQKSLIFEKLCNDNGITYIDMHKPFSEYYNETYRLPKGFTNTKVGIGHLNQYGHKVIANTLFDVMTKEK